MTATTQNLQPPPKAVATVTECEACFTPDVCQLRGTCDHYAAEQLRVVKLDPPQAKAGSATRSKQKAAAVHALVNAGPFPGMSEAFNAHMGAECWTDPAYAPDAAMWAAAWRAAWVTAKPATPACPTGKCEDPARDCFGSGCLSDEPQSAVAAAFGGLVQTPQA